ncbi:phosphate transporter 1;4 [Actinidia rufa]|uniref:Phosphate transporter 14 n=1 Tax=Actinidia rufa TaxID=165716 RepID=A0A7J0H3M8_9ERIC|nr:phosphate transporter 1;4 [Actinidia rufa]
MHLEPASYRQDGRTYGNVSNLDFDELLRPHGYRASFMSFVDHVLRFHNFPCIKTFREKGYVGIHVSRLHTWISVAIDRCVQEIDIESYPFQYLSLPSKLFTSKTLVSLKLFSDLEIDFSGSVYLPNLKVLHISLHYPGNDLTQQLFSSYPLLEDLHIRANVKNDEEIIFNVCSPALNKLEFRLGVFVDDEYFQRGVMYSESKAVVNAPLLEDLTIADDYLAGKKQDADPLFMILEGITSVKFLTLAATTMGLPLFPNLAYLELHGHIGYSWRRLPDLLCNVPNLVTLVLAKEPTPEHEKWIQNFRWTEPQETPTCLLSHLETISMTGFKGKDDELDLLKYFLKYGKALEKSANAHRPLQHRPGYWFTVALIDRMGRFAIQILGFSMMTIFMFALSIPYTHWTHPDNRIGFVATYSLTFFFANFGPNATTFVVPAEIFPARLRSTCHGISAASGKLGVIVGAFGFLYLAQNQDKAEADAGYHAGIGVRKSLIDLGVINFLGTLFTFLVPESKGKSLEEMSGENEELEEPDQ